MKSYSRYKATGAPWLGDVPEHWDVEKLKYLVSLVGEKADGTGRGEHYVGLEHVQAGTGELVSNDEGMQVEAASTVNTFAAGDVLFGKLRPYLAKAVVTDGSGVCSSEFLVLRPTGTNPAYLKRCLLLDAFVKTVDASTFGSKMPRADWTFISQLRLPKPPPDEQQAIADYLDAEASRIMELIRQKEELIVLLREKSQSSTSDVLLGGASKVPKRPSGIPWLGDIPSSWRLCKVKHAIRMIEQGWSPECEARLAEPDEWGVLKAGACNHGVFSEDEHKALPSTLEPIAGLEVRTGDVLMSRASGSADLVGSVAYVQSVRSRLMLSDKMFRLVPELHVDGRYLAWTLNTAAHRRQILNCVRGSEGLARNISTADIKQLWIALPALAEQQTLVEIASHIAAEVSHLIRHTTQEIALLKELRAATIADAVLGRVDVRTAAVAVTGKTSNNPSV